MKTEAQKRAEKNYRARARDRGMKSVTVWLLPREHEILTDYVERSGHSINMAVQSAIIELRNFGPLRGPPTAV